MHTEQIAIMQLKLCFSHAWRIGTLSVLKPQSPSFSNSLTATIMMNMLIDTILFRDLTTVKLILILAEFYWDFLLE